MKKILVTFGVLACAGAALAQVDPTRPMRTGRGNVAARPVKVIVTHQTAAQPESDVTKLEKFQVTGSLMKHLPAKGASQR